MLKQRPLHYVWISLSLLLYSVIGYGIERYQTFPLFVSYFSLFGVYILIIRKHLTFHDQDLKFWIFAAVIMRGALLFAAPSLSDDYYRFVWDGRLLAAGYHPFAEVPSYYMSHQFSIPGIDGGLYDSLNSKHTYTIYPPVSQFIFWLSIVLSNGSVYGSMLIMKIIIFMFELGTLWMFTLVLRQFGQPRTRMLVYALNPLVILEFSGNLHFEGVMIFFLLASILFLSRKQQLLSSLSYALSICTKLIPLLLLPLLVRELGWKKAMGYWLLTGAFTLLLFLPLSNPEILYGLSTSLGYYFQRFEFNASLYYLVREAGYYIFGFNIIQFAGPVLAFSAAVLILTLSFRNLRGGSGGGNNDADLFKRMVWCLFIYLLSTTILHPWYMITLLSISLLTPYRFPVLWSALIFLTYSGYTEEGFDENLILVAAEYIMVIAYLLYETVWMNRNAHS
jgi:alpha-1,6-mannosyltransferase